jgi:pleckstrin homology domain-containing family G member 4
LLFFPSKTSNNSSVTFVIHLIGKCSKSSDSIGHVKVVLDKLDNSLKLLHGHVKVNSVLITLTSESFTKGENGSGESLSNGDYNEQLPISHTKCVYACTLEKLLEFIAKENLMSLGGNLLWEHDQHQWMEFFKSMEPLQSQCLIAGRRLVSVLNDIRNADLQGPPTRRQLHSQHRTLCRALMDADLQHLRRKGPFRIAELREIMKKIRKQLFTLKSSVKFLENDSHNDKNNVVGGGWITSFNNESIKQLPSSEESSTIAAFTSLRLNALITVFNEVDRAAKRLEQLTEQHRERLRELTRQRALEDEINEVRL